MIAVRTKKYEIKMNTNGNIDIQATDDEISPTFISLTPLEVQGFMEDIDVVVNYASEYRKKKGLNQL